MNRIFSILTRKDNWIISVICLAGIFCSTETFAQMTSIPTFMGRRNTNGTSDNPTTITAMTMDFDLNNNLADFMGDVVVDDPEMTISCTRMKIYMEDKNKPAADQPEKKAGQQNASESQTEKKKDAENALDGEVTNDDAEKDIPNEENASLSGNKHVTKVECIGNVVITRKQNSTSNEKTQEKATAGKAIYYCDTGVVDLLEKPVVYTQDNKKVTGRTLSVYLNEGGRIKITMGKIEDYNKTSVRDIGK